MFRNIGNHSFKSNNFEILHLNLSEKLYFYLWFDADRKSIERPLSVTINIDDIPDLINSKFQSKYFEIKDIENKITFAFTKIDDENYKVSSKAQSPLRSPAKFDVETNIVIKDVFSYLKEVLEQVIDLLAFYHSNIDWTKNEKESKNAKEMKKRIDKLEKVLSKL